MDTPEWATCGAIRRTTHHEDQLSQGTDSKPYDSLSATTFDICLKIKTHSSL
jgi:hypothetical protein